LHVVIERLLSALRSFGSRMGRRTAGLLVEKPRNSPA
jgi:hypothetical protein